MPAKTKPVHKSVTVPPVENSAVVESPVVETSMLPPLTQEVSTPDSSLRLSAEVEPQPVPAVDPVAQLASLPTSPEFSVPVTPENTTSGPKSKKILWLVVILFLLAGIGVVGFAIYQLLSSSKTPNTISQVVPSPAPVETVETPTPTPSPVLERSTLKIQVLNGSGTPGLAGKAKTFLEDLGYTDVATGNAPAYDFDTTEVSLSAAKLAFRDLLLTDLKTKYVLSDQVATLSADSSYDAVITLGQE